MDTYVLLSKYAYNTWWYSIILCIQFNLYWAYPFAAMMISTYYVNNKVADIINDHRFSLLQLNARRFTDAFDMRPIENGQLSTSNTMRSPHIELLQMPSLQSMETDRSESIPLVRVQAKQSSVASISTITESINNTITLKQILCHEKAFELYTWNLQYEFSIECILSFVEFIQFQEFVYLYVEENKLKYNNNHNINNSEYDGRVWCKTHKSPPNVPKSFIVWFDIETGKEIEKNYHFSMNEMDFKYMAQYKAYLLFLKYIDYGADFEVNISHRVRSGIRKLFSNKDDGGNWMYNDNVSLSHLLYLFNDICDQLYSLLNSSYDRFQMTSEFERLQNLVFI